MTKPGWAFCIGLLIAAGTIGCAQSLERGQELFREGKFAQAVEELEAVVAAAPDELGARYWLGRAYLGAGRTEQAQDTFAEVLERKASSIETRYWLGATLEERGDVEGARAAWREVLEREPGHAEAGKALAQLGARGSLAAAATVDGPGGMRSGPPEDRRVGFTSQRWRIQPKQVQLDAAHVYDYTFATAPTDWVPRGGIWESTNRWTCSPEWSWLGGTSSIGAAALWSKREFEGDITVEAYAAMKMGVAGGGNRYKNPNDINICVYGDGASLDSGYNFIMGGWLNSVTRIMKGSEVLAETREPEALLPSFADGMPNDAYEFHRKWWALRAEKHGSRLRFHIDDQLVLEADDPDPIPGGRLAMWTHRNGIIVPRIKIYYERERAIRTPVPGEDAIGPQTTELGPTPVRLVSTSHPSVQNDFEATLGTWAPRATLSKSNDPRAVDGKSSEEHEAWVTLSSPGAGGEGHCLKVVNRHSGGDVAVRITDERLDVRKLGGLSFDYRASPGLQVNLFAKVEGGLYEIVFTGRETASPLASILGKIAAVKTDGKWHQATFPLRERLEQIYTDGRDLECEELYFANRHADDYAMAGFGGNRAGATWYLDNFRLGGVGGPDAEFVWETKGDEPILRYAVVVDDEPDTIPKQANVTEARFAAAGLAAGRRYLHVRPELGGGSWGGTLHYAFTVDASGPEIAATTPQDGARFGGPAIGAKLTDGEGIGVAPRSIVMAVEGEEFGFDHRALSYEASTETVKFDPIAAGMAWEDGKRVQVEVKGAADYLGNALATAKRWSFVVDHKRDKTPPAGPEVASDLYLCSDDFETDLGQWHTYGGQEGAVVSQDASDPAGGRFSLKLHNYTNGGRFGAKIRKKPFDAGKYRLVSFDYLLPPRLRVDFAVYVNGDWKNVRFTDTDNPLGEIGEIGDVRADGQWHSAEVNLYELLTADDPDASSYSVGHFVLGDWGSTGNPEGATYYIDNFRIVPVIGAAGDEPLPIECGDYSGIKGYSWTVDTKPTTEPDRTVDGTLTRKALAAAGADDVWVHVRAVDGAGNWGDTSHRRLLVDGHAPTARPVTPGDGRKLAASSVEWELRDEGGAGIDPTSVRVQVNGTEYDIKSSGVTHDTRTQRLTWDGALVLPTPIIFEEGQAVEATLLAAADYAGNSITPPAPVRFVMDYASDNEPPRILTVRSNTHRTALVDTFETDLGQWATRAGAQGARVERVTEEPASGQFCVKLTHQEEVGNLGTTVCTEEIDVARYPIVAFDYKFVGDVHLDLMVKTGDEWHAIGLSDNSAGAVYRVRPFFVDGKWHTASFDLSSVLRRRQQRGRLKVSEMILVDRNKEDTPIDAVAYFDNFIIGKPGVAAPALSWKAVDATGVTGYSYELDQDSSTVPDEVSEGEKTSMSFERIKGGVWFFHLRARDGAGNWTPPIHYAMMHLGAPPLK